MVDADAGAPVEVGRPTPVEVGRPAPEFTLRDQHGRPVSLADFRGRRAVLLVFYPLAFTRICQGELCGIRDDLAAFQNDAAQVLAVSVDSVGAQRAWAEQQGYTFPLLADFWPHGAVARAYGVFDEVAGHAIRGTFLIDVDGVIRWRSVLPTGTARDQQEWRAALAEVTGAG